VGGRKVFASSAINRSICQAIINSMHINRGLEYFPCQQILMGGEEEEEEEVVVVVVVVGEGGGKWR